MRGLILFALIFTSLDSYSQEVGIPIGYTKNGNSVEVYSNIDSINCTTRFENFVFGDPGKYFIIDDKNCSSGKRWYIVYYRKSYMFALVRDFANSNEIDLTLSKFKTNYPEKKERYSFSKLRVDSLITAEGISAIKKEQENQKLLLEAEKRTLDSLDKVLSAAMKSAREMNIVLAGWTWNYSNEYSSFIDINFKVINPYRSKIKYIWFTVSGTNPVGDPVRDGRSGKFDVTVKGVGPIEYGKIGEYEFEDVFYSKIVDSMKVKQIKIQFFDGSIKLISKPISLDAIER